MIYIEERIVNLKDFEKLLGLLSISIQTGNLDNSLELVKELEDFEFKIEKRKVSYCE